MASILPFVQGLERVANPESFDTIYFQFFDSNSFKEALGLASNIQAKSAVLYIAAHASTRKVGGIQIGSMIEAIKDYVAELKENGTELVGIIFGSCLIGHAEEIKGLLPGTPIQWVIAFTPSMKWLDSTLIEIKLLSEFMTQKEVVSTRDDAIVALRASIELFDRQAIVGDFPKQKGLPAMFDGSLRVWVQGKGQGRKVFEISGDLFEDKFLQQLEEVEQFQEWNNAQ